MNYVPVEARVRRPQHHEPLIVELMSDARFPTLRDVLLFAAAVGCEKERTAPFTASGEPVRFEVLTAPTYSESLINMIAADVAPDDPEILDTARIEERIRAFEEHANGGLEYIQEQVNVRHQPAARIVVDLVTEAFSHSRGAEPATVDELLGGVSWT